MAEAEQIALLWRLFLMHNALSYGRYTNWLKPLWRAKNPIIWGVSCRQQFKDAEIAIFSRTHPSPLDNDIEAHPFEIVYSTVLLQYSRHTASGGGGHKPALAGLFLHIKVMGPAIPKHMLENIF